MRSAVLGIAAALCAACATAGVPPELARPEGPVADYAELLSVSAESELNEELRRYFDATGNALVVASVPSLEGQTIEELSLATARRWGIGDRETMRGLLIMVAPAERRVRIEVACGLESVITNERAAMIIEDIMLPLFRIGRLEDATIAGARALMQATEDYRSELGKPAHSPGCLKEAA